MLIYEKTIDGVRHLYGTLNNIPSVDDPQLAYKDANGKEIDNIAEFKLFYGTDKLMKASLQTLPTEEDIDVNVFIGDVLIIGDGGEEPSEESGIYFYNEETSEFYLGTPWAQVKEDFPDAFAETEEGLSIVGDLDNYTSYFKWITGSWKIVIDKEIHLIGFRAFQDCGDLVEVFIPNGVKSIGHSAFDTCQNLASINIPDSVTSIGDFAFYEDYALKGIVIPNNVVEIGEEAFNGCSDMTFVTIGNSVKSIGKQAFYNCRGITSIVFPDSVTSIDEYAFRGCTNLANITFSKSLSELPRYTFTSCGIVDLILPSNIASIGDNAFSSCQSIVSIACEALTPPTIMSTTFSLVDTNIPVYVPASAVSAYQSDQYWSTFTNIQAIQ